MAIDRRRLLMAGSSVVIWQTGLFGTFTSVARADDVYDVRAGMVDRARYYLGTTDWEPSQGQGTVDKQFYCNIFIADVASDVGGKTWDMIPGSFGPLNEHDPLASDWANPDVIIKGWDVVFHPGMTSDALSPSDIFAYREPGDVISDGQHVAIMSDDSSSSSKLVFSASSKTGKVELNDWSFRLPKPEAYSNAAEYDAAARKKASAYSVRRFVGVS